MSTMTVIDDYVDALLDVGAPDTGRGHARPEHDPSEHDAAMEHDALGHDRIDHDGPRFECLASGRAPLDAPAIVDMTETMAPAAADRPGDPLCTSPRSKATIPEPTQAQPSAFVPDFVPAIMLPAAPPLAPHPAIPRDAASAAREASVATKVAASHRWLRVTVGNDSYGMELLRVQEVVRLAPIVALRGAARAVLGVMNLRGRIVPVIDLGLWLQAGCVHADERSRIVVVERDDEMIGMLVSAVEDVVTLGRERIEPPLASSDPGAIVGIARVGGTPTVLLDANALFG